MARDTKLGPEEITRDIPNVSEEALKNLDEAGIVYEVRVFNRHGVDKDERALAIEREEIERLAKDRDDEQAILDRNVFGRLAELLEGRQGIAGPKGFKKDSKITRAVLDEYPRAQWWLFASPNDKLMAEIEAIRKQYEESKKGLEQRFLD